MVARNLFIHFAFLICKFPCSWCWGALRWRRYNSKSKQIVTHSHKIWAKIYFSNSNDITMEYISLILRCRRLHVEIWVNDYLLLLLGSGDLVNRFLERDCFFTGHFEHLLPLRIKSVFFELRRSRRRLDLFSRAKLYVAFFGFWYVFLIALVMILDRFDSLSFVGCLTL